MKKILFPIILLLVCTGCIFASEYDYSYYRTQLSVGRDAVHQVREDFIADFHIPSHGLYRFIPYEYDNAKVKITDLKCSDDFSYSTENGYVVMKIGSYDRTHYGEKQYAVSYSYDVGEDTEPEYDFLYFNLLGTDYDCSTGCFDFEVLLPSENLSEKDFEVSVSGGYYGSEVSVPFQIENDGENYRITGTLYNVKPYQGVTVRILLPQDWYMGARKIKDFRSFFRVADIAGSLFLVALAYFVWSLYGRDSIPIVSAKFEAPENYSPLFVGYLADEAVNDTDITSMLFYWADKGYIKIAEPKKKHYEFTKLKDLPNDVPAVEREIFFGFFRGCDENGTIRTEDLKYNEFYQVIARAKYLVPKYFRGEKRLTDPLSVFLSFVFALVSAIPLCLSGLSLTATELMQEEAVTFCLISLFPVVFNAVLFISLMKKWYIRKSNTFAVVFRLILILFEGMVFSVMSSSFNGFNPALSCLSFVCSIVISFLAVIMVKRNEYGRKLYEEVLGFREFIDKVSMSELVTMINEDPMYYYHILCYAIVLGLETKWAKKFESVAVQPPVWYTGISPFDVYFMSSFATHVCRSVAVSSIPVQKTKSVIGGPMHFGGFSGGGFGGGGSRAW